MENLGALAVLIAFCLAVYAIAASIAGRWRKNPFLIVSAERAVYAVCALVTVAAGVLVYAFLTDDFRFYYVAMHSDRAMPTVYKFSAWWSGQEGSLLLWSWILSIYCALAVVTCRKKLRDVMPWAIVVLMATQTLFLVLNAFVVSPFKMLAASGAITAIPDGRGLSPILQYWAMAIHPPILYLGYVGMVVPFAFAIGSLVTRQPGDAWLHTTRRWSLITWLFQGVGVMLGQGWAYSALGWGGYWAWDPVENASLLPWLSSTAYLHSVMMQEKKGMMKVWNAVLVSASFFLCIFGTFLTRSGVVSSVHAFAQSPIGNYFIAFLAVGVALTIYLILDRLDYLKSEQQLESVISRESSFLFNNLVLLASCFAILWGTLFPVISEYATGEKIALDPTWFNRLMVPIGLFLLLLTGVGPLFAWRRTSIDSLRRNFLWPGLAACGLVAVLIALGIRSFYPLISFGFCLFVTLTIAMEFYRGSAAIASKQQMNLVRAAVELTHRNTRRYGGYIVHMGFVLMVVGFSGAAFNDDKTIELAKGETAKLGHYDLKLVDVADGDNPSYVWQHAVLDVYQNGALVGTLKPERQRYKASNEPVGRVSIRRRINEDLYVNFAGLSDRDPSKAVINAYIFPLVMWVWIGTVVLLVGTLIAMIPSKVQRQYARTEVVGVTRKHVPVEG